MANARKYIDAPNVYESEQEPIYNPDEEEAFYEWFLQRCLKQLFDAHSSMALRWDIKHWVFTYSVDGEDLTPYPFSFVDTCNRLRLDPEALQGHIRYMMDKNGITRLMNDGLMAVKDKRKKAEVEQGDMLGIDWNDPGLFASPDAIPGLSKSLLPREASKPESHGKQSDLFG